MRGQPGGRAFGHGDGDSMVERDHRAGREAAEHAATLSAGLPARAIIAAWGSVGGAGGALQPGQHP